MAVVKHMEHNKERRFGLNANQLRFLALFFMLLDHMWATVISGQLWMTCVGRLAFPIFAFQISEGFLHTSNVRSYAKRLLVFALIAEIPFNLMLSGSWIFPFHQNVLFTLLLGLVSIAMLDEARKEPTVQKWAKTLIIVFLCLLVSTLGLVDYGAMGVVTVILFYLARGFKGAKLVQLAGMILLNCFILPGMEIELSLFDIRFMFPGQGFAVLALILIWLYNGEKGRSSKALQYGAYAFYPVHALILYLIAHFA